MRLASALLLITLTSLHSYVGAIPTLQSLQLPSLLSQQNLTTFNLSRTDRLGNEFKCFDFKLFASRRANWGDCARAIALLPNDHVPGMFVRGPNPKENTLHLPHSEKWQTCRVTVDLLFGFKSDESSWLGINIAASEIINACRVGQGDNAKTGGYTNIGTGEGISVTMERDRPGLGSGNTATSSQ